MPMASTLSFLLQLNPTIILPHCHRMIMLPGGPSLPISVNHLCRYYWKTFMVILFATLQKLWEDEWFFFFPSSVLVALETLTSFDSPLDITFTDQSSRCTSRLAQHHWPTEARAREQGTGEAQKGSQSEWFKYRHLLLLTPSVLFVQQISSLLLYLLSKKIPNLRTPRVTTTQSP